MQIVKEVKLSEEEISKLTEAGQLLGGIKQLFEAGEADRLSQDTKGLIQAIKTVLEEVLSF